MNTTMLRLSIVLLTMIAGLSCNDQGDAVKYVEIAEILPAPNSSNVDKAATVYVRLTSGVSVNEAAKIQLRYVDDVGPINSFAGCGLTPPIVDVLCVGPYMWKPGKTVEVSIPKGLADSDGNSLKQSLVYRFTIAQDTIPFDLLEIHPNQSDTVSLNQTPWASFRLVFNDYLWVRDSMLTVDPPATLWMFVSVVVDGRSSPRRDAGFSVRHLRPFTEYTVTIPLTIKDYEGEMLPHDYHIVFHTKP